MSDIKKLQELVKKFRDDRDWKQFHEPKDLAIALQVEASELLDEFKWKSKQEIEQHLKDKPEAVSDELVDVLYYVLLMSADLNINIVEEFNRKMAQNENKYPVEKSKGNHKKYTEHV